MNEEKNVGWTPPSTDTPSDISNKKSSSWTPPSTDFVTEDGAIKKKDNGAVSQSQGSEKSSASYQADVPAAEKTSSKQPFVTGATLGGQTFFAPQSNQPEEQPKQQEERIRLSPKYVDKLNQWTANRSESAQIYVDSRINSWQKTTYDSLKKKGLQDEDIISTLNSQARGKQEEFYQQFKQKLDKDHAKQIKYYSDLSESERIASMKETGAGEAFAKRAGTIAKDVIPSSVASYELRSIPANLTDLKKSTDINSSWRSQMDYITGSGSGFDNKSFLSGSIDDMIKKSLSESESTIPEKVFNLNNLAYFGKGLLTRMGITVDTSKESFGGQQSKYAGGTRREVSDVIHYALVNTKDEIGDSDDLNLKRKTFEKYFNERIAQSRKERLKEIDLQNNESEQFLQGIPMTWEDAQASGNKAAYIGGAIGNAAGTAAPAIAISALTGGAVIPAMVANFGLTYIMESGETYDKLLSQQAETLSKKYGYDVTREDVVASGQDDEAANIASNVGIINAGLETIGFAFGAGKLARAVFSKKMVNEAMSKNASSMLLDLTKGAAGATVSEAGTEMLQSLTSIVGGKILSGAKSIDEAVASITPEEVSDIYESGRQGGIGGLFFGGLGSTAEAYNQRNINKLYDNVTMMPDVALNKLTSLPSTESRENKVKAVVNSILKNELSNDALNKADIEKADSFINDILGEGGLKPKGIDKTELRNQIKSMEDSGLIKTNEQGLVQFQSPEAVKQMNDWFNQRVEKSPAYQQSNANPQEQISAAESFINDSARRAGNTSNLLLNKFLGDMSRKNEVTFDSNTGTYKVNTPEAAAKINRAATHFNIKSTNDILQDAVNNNEVTDLTSERIAALSRSGSSVAVRAFGNLAQKMKNATSGVLNNSRYILLNSESQATEIAKRLGKNISEETLVNGWYDKGSNTMFFVNNPNVAIHESVMHPIMNAVKSNSPEMYNRFASDVSNIMNTEGKSYMEDAKSNYAVYDNAGNITNQEEVTDEAIVNFMSDTASGKFKPTIIGKIADVIEKFLQSIGLSSKEINLDLSNPKTVQDFAGTISDALSKGKKVNIEVNNEPVQAISDNIQQGSDVQFSQLFERKELNIKQDDILTPERIQSEIVGNNVEPILYDSMRTGDTTLSNKALGFTQNVSDPQGGVLHMFLKPMREAKAVLAFTNLQSATKTLKNLLAKDAIAAITVQSIKNSISGNRTLRKAIFGNNGFIDKVVEKGVPFTDIRDAIVERLNNVSNIQGIEKIKKANNIKELHDVFGSISYDNMTGIFNALFPKLVGTPNKDMRVLQEKFGFPTREEIIVRMQEPALKDAEDFDVAAFAKVTEPIVLVPKSQMTEENIAKAKKKGITLEVIPDEAVHPAYPFALKGEPVGLVDKFIKGKELFKDLLKNPKSMANPAYALGRVKRGVMIEATPQGAETTDRSISMSDTRKESIIGVAPIRKFQDWFNNKLKNNEQVKPTDVLNLLNIRDFRSWRKNIIDTAKDFDVIVTDINNNIGVFDNEPEYSNSVYVSGNEEDIRAFSVHLGTMFERQRSVITATSNDNGDGLSIDLSVDPNADINDLIKNAMSFGIKDMSYSIDRNKLSIFAPSVEDEKTLNFIKNELERETPRIQKDGHKKSDIEYIEESEFDRISGEYRQRRQDKGKSGQDRNNISNQEVTGTQFSKTKKAPNGSPSNLTDSQWEQVRTPEFKAWFGDWENDPENASSVVDENGEPLVLYHGTGTFFESGTGNNFDQFTPSKRRTSVSADVFDFRAKYSFFTWNPNTASDFADLKGNQQTVYPVFVNARNVINSNNLTEDQDKYFKDELKRTDVNKVTHPYLTINQFVDGMKDSYSNWRYVENKAFDNMMSHFKNDGVVLFENGEWTIAIPNSNQVKSAIANTGQFNAADNRIQFSKTKKAPNGNPSNLNDLQWEQVRTPEFKNWFGDWENDPANASKTLDENGEPKVYYHGTSKDKDFKSFNVNQRGAWFTESPEEASSYAVTNDSQKVSFENGGYVDKNISQRVFPVFLNAKNIAKLDDYYSQKERENLYQKYSYQKSQRLMFSDIFYKEQEPSKRPDAIDVGKGVIVIMKSPNQIKSAIGNTGKFSTTKDDIQFSQRKNSESLQASLLEQSGINEVLKAAGLTEQERQRWKDQNRRQVNKYRNQSVQDALKMYKAGKITQQEYINTVRSEMPIGEITNPKRPATFADIVRAIDGDKIKNGIIGLTKNINDGALVSLRLDIPAYNFFDIWVPTIHEFNTGKVAGYTSAAKIRNVSFSSSPSQAMKVAEGTAKSPFAKMDGEWVNSTPEDLYQESVNAMNNPQWVQVGMNPERHSWFYDRSTGNPIASAEEVIQVGSFVLAKNPVFADVAESRFDTGQRTPQGEPVMFSQRRTTRTTDRVIKPETSINQNLHNELADSIARSQEPSQKFTYNPQKLNEAMARFETMSPEQISAEMSQYGGYELLNLASNLNGTNNLSAIAFIQIFNKATAEKNDALASDAYDALNKIGSAAGQLLRQFRELKSAVKSPRDVVRTIVEKHFSKHGFAMTDSMRVELNNIINNYVGNLDIERANKAAYENDRTKANHDKYEASVNNTDMSFAEVENFMTKYTAPSLSDLANLLIKGNLLTLGSITINTTSNIINALQTGLFEGQLRPLARSIGRIATGRKSSGYGIGTSLNALGYASITFTNNILPALRESFTKKGVRPKDMAKFETNRNIHPITALRQIYKSSVNAFTGRDVYKTDTLPKVAKKMANGETKYYTPAGVYAGKVMEGVFGWPAAFMFRMLYATDKPFKAAAKIFAATQMMSEQRNGAPVSIQDVVSFMDNANSSEKEKIDRYSEQFAYSYEKSYAATKANKMSRLMQSFGDDIINSNLGVAGKMTGTMFKMIGTSIMPYVTVPANVLSHFVELIMPPVAISASLKYYNQGDKAMGDQMVGRAALGSIFYLTAGALYTAGLIMAGDDEDKSNDRALKNQLGGQRSLNISGMIRMMNGGNPAYKSGDHSLPLQKLGIFGLFADFQSRWAEELKNSGMWKDDYWTTMANSHWDESLGAYMQSSLKASLDLSFFYGQFQLMESIKGSNGDPMAGFNRFASGLFDTMSNIVWANQYSMIAQGIAAETGKRPSMLKPENPTLRGLLYEKMAKKMPWIDSESDLFPVLDLWGKPVPNSFWNVNNPFKVREITDETSMQIWNLMAKTGQTNPIVFTPKKLTIDEVEYKLEEADYLTLQSIAGDFRKAYINELMQSSEYEISDDNEKLDLIKEENRYANQDAKDLFEDMWYSSIDDGSLVIDEEKGTYKWVDKAVYNQNRVSRFKNE